VGFFAKSVGEYQSSVEFYNWEFKPALSERHAFKVKNILFYGISDEDHVDLSEVIAPDGYGDGRFFMELEGSGVAITAIEIRGYCKGKNILWNTIPGDGVPSIAVLDKSRRILNSPSGSVNIPVSGDSGFDLYVSVPETIPSEDFLFEAILWLSNGGKISFPVQKKEIYRFPLNVKECTVLGIGVKDYVSNSEELKKDLKPDLQLKLTVEGNGIITGIELYSGNNSLVNWNTYFGDGHPVIAVTDESGEILSAYDGSLCLKVCGCKVFELWCY